MNKLFQLILCSFLVVSVAFSEDGLSKSFWNLPKKLSSKNTQVDFIISSTWHDVSASARQVDGDVWLENPKDFNSIRAKITLPVSRFNSENETRDEKMRKVMAVETFPNVVFELSNIEGLVHPQNMTESMKYPIRLNGYLTIRGTKKKIQILSSIIKTKEKFDVAGDVTIDWSEYGVEDPSIIVAKVYRDLKISFKMGL